MTTTAALAFQAKPHQTTTAKATRIELVDALRGFAICAIMLLHNLEHFDFIYRPEQLPGWIKALDAKVWDTVSFLFAGKAYAIFALLFGFTFFIQMDNQAKKGVDFRLRFLWRLFLLMLFGCVNALFYQGDILSLYAILGVALVPVAKWSNRAILILAIILVLQPLEWANVIHIANHPDYVAPKKLSSPLFQQSEQIMAGDSFPELVKSNFFVGRLAVWYWSWEKGRFFQTPALFLFGMLIGRKRLFLVSEENKKYWKGVLLVSFTCFVPLFYLKGNMSSFITQAALAKKLGMIITTWSNFAFMLVLVSSFICFYYRRAGKHVLDTLAPLGRMSLTNYITQSIVGTFLYYGYGLALYQYTGATYCLLIGLLLFTLQLLFCRWWLSRHKQGPLENLWHRATWI